MPSLHSCWTNHHLTTQSPPSRIFPFPSVFLGSLLFYSIWILTSCWMPRITHSPDSQSHKLHPIKISFSMACAPCIPLHSDKTAACNHATTVHIPWLWLDALLRLWLSRWDHFPQRLELNQLLQPSWKVVTGCYESYSVSMRQPP